MIGYENPEILVVPLRILNHLVLNSASFCCCFPNLVRESSFFIYKTLLSFHIICKRKF